MWPAPGDPALVFRTSCLRRTPESEVVPLKDDWKPEVTEAFFHFRYLGTVDIFFTDYVRSICIFKHFVDKFCLKFLFLNGRSHEGKGLG